MGEHTSDAEVREGDVDKVTWDVAVVCAESIVVAGVGGASE